MSLKTLRKNILLNRRKKKIPRSVQQNIPIDTIYKNGIFRTGRIYSQTFRFEDINYVSNSKNGKLNIFTDYVALLNSLDAGCNAKITINNKRRNKEDFKKNILLPYKDDGFEHLRKEMNDERISKAKSSNLMIQEKYITISNEKRNIEEASNYFSRIRVDLEKQFAKLNSQCDTLNYQERMKILKDFYRPDDVDTFEFNMDEDMVKGQSFKDYICPLSMWYKKDYFEMDNKVGRVLFLHVYPNNGNDQMINELCSMNKTMMLSIDILPIPTDEAVRELEKRVLSTETNATRWQQRQNENNNFSAVLPYDLQVAREEAHEYLRDITSRDQKMMLATVTIVHLADTIDELNKDSDILKTIGKQYGFEFKPLNYQQEPGLNTVVPFGVKQIDATRTLLTESVANLIPFNAQDILHPGGIYYGINKTSGNMIIADKKKLMNGNSIILGVPGSGKSFTAKKEIISQFLTSDCDIILIDPEREYGAIVRELRGETIFVSADSSDHINAMDINANYNEDGDPVTLKSEFVLSFIEQALGYDRLTAVDKSIIDSCTRKVYQKYINNKFHGTPPTLVDLCNELEKEGDEGKNLSKAISLYVRGSFNTFAKQTNVDVNNRLICYDILELGDELMSLGMLVVLDSILNRITRNRKAGRTTYIIIDEIYLLFKHEYSANFLFKLWKRVRKYGAFCTGITQNVEDMLNSPTARTMLSNSEFVIMLNLAINEQDDLARVINISDEQLKYVTNVNPGSGLIKFGKSLIPFTDDFAKYTILYGIMTTKPGEATYT